MNVRVAVAGRQGAANGIAEAIGRRLRTRGLEATVAAPGEIAHSLTVEHAEVTDGVDDLWSRELVAPRIPGREAPGRLLHEQGDGRP
jgi:hypothetical protein